MNANRAIFVLAAAGGLLATLHFSTASARADVWNIFDDQGAALVSESGVPLLYQSTLEQGTFDVDHPLGNGEIEVFLPHGLLSITNSLGMTNEDLVVGDDTYPDLPDHSVIDVTSFAGIENIYSDLVGQGTGGTNEIADTLVTPFGNFDIPTTFDAAATVASAATATDWTSALDADWATLVADFSALF